MLNCYQCKQLIELDKTKGHTHICPNCKYNTKILYFSGDALKGNIFASIDDDFCNVTWGHLQGHKTWGHPQCHKTFKTAKKMPTNYDGVK